MFKVYFSHVIRYPIVYFVSAFFKITSAEIAFENDWILDKCRGEIEHACNQSQQNYRNNEYE